MLVRSRVVADKPQSRPKRMRHQCVHSKQKKRKKGKRTRKEKIKGKEKDEGRDSTTRNEDLFDMQHEQGQERRDEIGSLKQRLTIIDLRDETDNNLM